MSNFSVAIVGLPNAGKSTLFNALLKRQIAQVAPYPLTTIQPNVGIVPVPDERLEKLKELIKPQKTVPATVEFIDIAGLVKNAHQREGLGNQFLAKIRECNAICHIIRSFSDSSVSHYYQKIDPQRDKEIVDLELELAEIKKPTLYVINVDEIHNSKFIIPNSILINAKTGEGIDQLIKKAYQLLNLITFYTIKGGQEVTAWALPQGKTAIDAAGIVHTDMAKGFIKAEVINWQDFQKFSSWEKAKKAGKIILVGKDYPIKGGDIIEIKFH